MNLLLLIGCGKMGSAMLTAWLRAGLISRAMIVDRNPNDTAQRFSDYAAQIDVYADVSALPADMQPDMVMLATKPQQMMSLLLDLAPRVQPDWPVMTIAAGLKISFYETYLLGNPIIRLMPNTPSLIGKGMTVASGVSLPAELKERIETLMRCNGDFMWLDSEAQLDGAMAISGSGPAYFFYLAEQLAKVGEAHGLSEAQGMRLARQTMIGAGAIAEHQAAETLAQLRLNVTSPGGVTAAAIAAWEERKAFAYLVAAGVAANIARSKEIAQGR